MLRQQLSLSSAEITRLKKKENGITVNERHVTVRYILRQGDILCLDLKDNVQMPQNILPFNMPIDIIYEDADIIALNKPYGMPTHPSHNHYTDTLANALMHHFNKKGESCAFRAVNRLDKDTSGIVLCAKTSFACARLCKNMQSGNFQKTYFALVNGKCAQHGFIEKNIRRYQQSVILRCVCEDNEGKYAKTEYFKMSEKNDISLVKLIPHTGRTHQLRVHMQYMGIPILGDVLYSADEDIPMMLHAGGLEFSHPVSEEKIVLSCPLPERFEKYI